MKCYPRWINVRFVQRFSDAIVYPWICYRRREEDEDYMDSHEINYIDDRRPSGRRGQRIEDPNYRHAEQPPPPWNSEWFDDARRTDQGGAFSLVKR